MDQSLSVVLFEVAFVATPSAVLVALLTLFLPRRSSARSVGTHAVASAR